MQEKISYQFRKELNPEEYEQAITLYQSLDEVSIQQHPDWALKVLSHGLSNHCFFLAKDTEKDTILAFASVAERFGKEAIIQFGPIASDKNTLVKSIHAICQHYKSQGFFYLGVQLGMTVSNDTAFIQYHVFKESPFNIKIDPYNWSSATISLNKEPNELLKSFSSNHKRAIKKAGKNGLYIDTLHTEEEIVDFSKLYVEMYKSRGLPVDEASETKTFLNIQNHLFSKGNGHFLGVKKEGGELIGGICVVYQGNSAFYYKGFAKASERKLPILHFAFFEAFLQAKDKGLTSFDLGGFNHLVAEDSQVGRINQFKKGFYGTYIFYPPIMHFKLNKIGYALYNFARNLRRKFLNS